MKSRLLAVLLALSSAGCASVSYGPAFRKIDNPPQDRAVVYIYRPHLPFAFGEVYDVSANGKFVSKIGDGGYIQYLAEPGTLELSVRRPLTLTEKLPLEVRGGEIHYVQVTVTRGILVAQPKFIQQSPEYAQNEIMQCRLNK
jgi:hypothetical protein